MVFEGWNKISKQKKEKKQEDICVYLAFFHLMCPNPIL